MLSRLFFGVCCVCALSACSLFDGLTEVPRGTAAAPSMQKAPIGVTTQTASPMETLKSLLPPEGLHFKPLFNEKMSDTDDRFKRLEFAVQDMRNDLDTVVPALARMAEIDRANKAVAVQQQALASAATPVIGDAPVSSTPVALVQSPPPAVQPEMAAATAPQPAAAVPPVPELMAKQALPQAAPEAVKPAESAPAPAAPAPAAPLGDVKALRMADHKDMTRLVLDMTAEYKGSVQLDSDGKRLVVSLQGLNWLGQKSVEVSSAELVSGYRVADGNLYVDLMYPTQIKERKMMLPGADSKDYRAVIDLYSADVHKK